jgi:flavin reductase
MVDQATFREAMAGLGAAVSIVTSDGEAGLAGCTASAVCGVTDAPPTLLVCINRSSRNNEAIRRNGRLCINVLHADQKALAAYFSSAGTTVAQRYAAAQWDSLATGAPVLRDALASLDCEVTSVNEIGTHSVFFCTVQATRTRQACDALIYYRRSYHRIAGSDAHAAQ